MMLRTLLAVLLTVASVATAWAQCRVGASFEHAMAQAGMHDATHAMHEHADCAKRAPRACDSMVQATAPHIPVLLAPSAAAIAIVPVAALVLHAPTIAGNWQRDRPPDRSPRFKDIYATNGRLLV